MKIKIKFIAFYVTKQNLKKKEYIPHVKRQHIESNLQINEKFHASCTRRCHKVKIIKKHFHFLSVVLLYKNKGLKVDLLLRIKKG